MPVDEAEPFDRDKAAAKYLDRVQQFARKLAAGRPPEVVEDAEGDSLVAMTKALNNYRPELGEFESFLMMTVRRRVLRLIRRHVQKQLDRPAVVHLYGDEDAGVPPSPEPVRQELSADTRERLRHRPDLLRAVDLVYRQGVSRIEAAELLGWGVSTLGVKLREAAEELGPDWVK